MDYCFITDECIKCGYCVDACPFGLIYDKGDKYQIDIEKCFGCKLCVDACIYDAIKY